MQRFLIAFGFVCWSTAAVAVPVRVAVRLSGPAPEGARKARITWSSSLADIQGGSALVDVPGDQALDLAPGPAWTFRAELDGFWSEEKVLAPRATGERPVEIVLYPAGSLEGTLDLPAGQTEAPSGVSVRFRPAPAPPGSPGQRLPEGTVSCPVAKGVWRCSLPAGAWDLRLKAGPYIPAYLWGVAVRAAHAMSRLEALLLEARTNDRGFFQLEAVPPGRYKLTVSSPGFAATEVGPVEVRSGLEAEVLDRIVLRKPVRFEALLDPPLDPYGQPWRIVLQATPPASARHEALASAEGHWAQANVVPGQYNLAVLGDLGSRWLTEEVAVVGGQAPLLVQIPLVEIHGRLRQGDEPLAATLWFGGLAGARRIRFDADEDGELSGYLPEEGLWKVELVEESAGLRVGLEPVEVRRLPGARRAEVEIVVPVAALVTRAAAARAEWRWRCASGPLSSAGVAPSSAASRSNLAVSRSRTMSWSLL